MSARLIGALAAGCVGLGGYLTLAGKGSPPAAPPPTRAAAVPTPPVSPPAPAVLPEVIELADLDPLLDPPAKAVVGAPFDAAPGVPASAASAPERIPPAVD